MSRNRDEFGGDRITTVEARQAVTGHHVFRVLAVGLVLAAIAGVVLYFTVGV